MTILLRPFHLFLLAFTLALTLGSFSCGDAEDDCEDVGGKICNNCATDCDITCGSNETENCVGLTYFGGENPDDLRCVFCE
jgi:hypothetical protein